jgi:hypothetical protein
MATSTYLSSPVTLVNSIDLSDQCTGATVNINYDQLEATAFGDGSRKYVSGLGSHSITLDFYASFAATESWITLSSLVGTSTTVIVQPTAGTESATNPKMTLTGCFLATVPVVTALGALGTISVTFNGGVYTTDVTPA